MTRILSWRQTCSTPHAAERVWFDLAAHSLGLHFAGGMAEWGRFVISKVRDIVKLYLSLLSPCWLRTAFPSPQRQHLRPFTRHGRCLLLQIPYAWQRVYMHRYHERTLRHYKHRGHNLLGHPTSPSVTVQWCLKPLVANFLSFFFLLLERRMSCLSQHHIRVPRGRDWVTFSMPATLHQVAKERWFSTIHSFTGKSERYPSPSRVTQNRNKEPKMDFGPWRKNRDAARKEKNNPHLQRPEWEGKSQLIRAEAKSTIQACYEQLERGIELWSDAWTTVNGWGGVSAHSLGGNSQAEPGLPEIGTQEPGWLRQYC